MKTNLMEINSPNIGTMNSVNEYQRLFINNKISDLINSENMKVNKNAFLNVNIHNLDEIWRKLEKDFELYQLHNNRVLIIGESCIADIWWMYKSTHTGLTLSIASSSIDKCYENIDLIKKSLEEFLVTKVPMLYTIIQYDGGNLKETNYQDTIEINFNPKAVPFIDNADQYIDDFFESSASILILYGTPGTGKSTFIKYLLSKLQNKILENEPQCKVLYSFDENILYTSEFFHQLIYEDHDVVVLEDFNQTIHKNSDTEGTLNPLNKLLSLSDGVLSKDKKIIITTNIESNVQIHSTLTRPGRCFDSIHFRDLEGEEIDNLCKEFTIDRDPKINKLNLSEFFANQKNQKNKNVTKTKIGY